MKYLIFTLLLFLQLIIVKGQTSIEGVYGLKNGRNIFKFTEDFKYYYKVIFCTGSTTDSGYYSLSNDTIYFKSLIQIKDIKSNIIIWDDSWKHKKNAFIDTLLFSIQNLTIEGFVYDLKLKLNDSLIFQVDSINYKEEKQIKIPIFRNSDDGILKINICGIDKSILLDKEVFVKFTFNGENFTRLTDKYVYKRNKIYSVDIFKSRNKKFYLYKK